MIPESCDRIVVSVASRHGRTRLHTFARAVTNHPKILPESFWVLATPMSRKQQAQWDAERAAAVKATTGINGMRELIEQARPKPRRDAGSLLYGDVIGSDRIPLGEGVEPVGRNLAVALDALHAAGRSEVDLRDLKVVFSQLGSRIVQFTTLPDDQRGIVESALHSEIVRRCTRI